MPQNIPSICVRYADADIFSNKATRPWFAKWGGLTLRCSLVLFSPSKWNMLSRVKLVNTQIIRQLQESPKQIKPIKRHLLPSLQKAKVLHRPHKLTTRKWHFYRHHQIQSQKRPDFGTICCVYRMNWTTLLSNVIGRNVTLQGILSSRYKASRALVWLFVICHFETCISWV